MSKAATETDMHPPLAEGRHRIVRPILSPEVSELLNMLEAFERSLAPDVVPSRS